MRSFSHLRVSTMDLACALLVLVSLASPAVAAPQPLARLAMEQARMLLDSRVSISVTPDLLGTKGEAVGYVTVTFNHPTDANDSDWIGVFSPAKFDASICPSPPTTDGQLPPLLCTAPVKYSYANFSSPNYANTGSGTRMFRLSNMRADYSFGFFKGDVDNPVLLAVSNTVKFANPKGPNYVRLSVGKEWNEMMVTWSSGYSANEATPLVKWSMMGEKHMMMDVAGTLTYTRGDMCGAPANTVGWRDPGFIHSASLKGLWPSVKYSYQVGHKTSDGSYDWGIEGFFTSAPYPGQDSVQKIIIFGDMGKGERDGTNEFNNDQPASINTTDRLIEDLANYDMIIHNGDITYADGYLAQWDQFLEQISPFSSRVPYMISSGNHERDWPLTGSYFNITDSGGECGVVTSTLFNMPAKNRQKFWYALDWGMFHFCIGHSEEDWREGTEQYKFLEECFASVDRQKQPWLIFLAHRVLGYSSGDEYAVEGTFNENGGREYLENLWQKYKVDLGMYGHVHNYERTCPVYTSNCVSDETEHYSGQFNGTIHIVAGGAGKDLSPFGTVNTTWSVFKDYDHGFTKLTAFNHSTLLVEYKRSADGKLYDQFWFTREYKDVLGCDAVHNFCPVITLGG